MGKGRSSNTTYKPGPEEGVMATLAAKRASDPAVFDNAALARALGTEALSRFNEPAQMDPRSAGILSLLMPQMSVEQNGMGSLLSDFMNAPTSTPLGVRGYGATGAGRTMSSAPFDLASMTGRDAVLAPFTRFQADIAGSQPDAGVTGGASQVGRRLSQQMIDQLTSNPNRSREDQQVMGEAGRKKSGSDATKRLWQVIFGLPTPQEGG